MHGGLSPGAPRGSKNGNFRTGHWTANWASSHWNPGFVAGAGAEYKLAPNVIVGLEYDYVGLSTRDQAGPITGLPPVFWVVHGVNANVQSVTARISLLFGK